MKAGQKVNGLEENMDTVNRVVSCMHSLQGKAAMHMVAAAMPYITLLRMAFGPRALSHTSRYPKEKAVLVSQTPTKHLNCCR